FNHVLIGEDSLTYPQRIKEVNKDFFKKLAYIGREFSLTLAVENRYERGIYGYLPKDLIELVNNINDDHLKICLDTGHSVINGFQPSEYYKSLHPYVALIHAHDNDCSKDLHLPPYTGCIDWDSFLNTLKEFKYNNIMVFEVACSDSLRRCDNMVVVLKMLRDLFRSKLI
ncbi:MAG: sugar phosphate isomerase/epimerase, partial [Sulfolobales archaeon]